MARFVTGRKRFLLSLFTFAIVFLQNPKRHTETSDKIVRGADGDCYTKVLKSIEFKTIYNENKVSYFYLDSWVY